ncbi:hypothetical protein GCM10010919_32290 [Alishewanella longhuensis]|uniref:Uncharacterized protein n=1 Tax=Alishewanella longhuensis TaxID=1091037 RepID=A0ABQ3L435_9ALTE|nr:hypothetical protein [Alishewanella longhuensis]GHG76967.1 hypothetical protein GCM10010919_32290 [Alishewanella longhuensis]
MKFKLLALAAVFAATTASAAVTYDENGVGYVGKGDVQSLFDWNNSAFQNNAALVQFRFSSGAQQASWVCGGYNNGGNYVTHPKNESYDSISGSINFHPKQKNQITGFILLGTESNVSSSTAYLSPGECVAPNKNWTDYALVEGSLTFESADPLLEVSVDGEAWYPLAITE